MSGELTLRVETEPSDRDVAALANGLTQHALPTTGRPGFQPLAVFARDPAGALVGGVSGTVNWNWLHIALFWISSGKRRAGFGSRLLRAIEAAALERGCSQAHLDTFSYQARPFYERHGYELFATLEDYPPGHSRYFLRKRLGVGAPDERVGELSGPLDVLPRPPRAAGTLETPPPEERPWRSRSTGSRTCSSRSAIPSARCPSGSASATSSA